MKATVKGKDLLTALAAAGSVVKPKQTLPVLSGVLLELWPGRGLTVKATDLEQAVAVTVEASVETGGAIVVQAAKLLAIAKETAVADAVSLSLGGSLMLTVKGAGGTWKMTGMDPKDYPAVKTEPAGQPIVVKAPSLLTAIQRTEWACGTDETRYALTGMHFVFGGLKLMIETTDGHRMTQMVVPLETNVEQARNVLVPPAAAATLARLLKGREEASLYLSDAALDVVVKGAGTFYCVRLLEGRFPETDKIFESARAGTSSATLPAVALADVVRKVALMSDERTHPVKLVCGDGKIKALALNPEQGESEAEMEVAWNGKPVMIGVNAGYVLEYLNGVAGEIELRLESEMSPIFMGGPGQQPYVVMPMRVG